MPQYLSREEQGLPEGDPDVEQRAAETGEEVAAQEAAAVEGADGAPDEEPVGGGLGDAPAVSRAELEEETKDDLLERARAQGKQVSASDNKAEIIDALLE